MVFIEPLDLETIFIQYFAGGATVFFFIAMALMAYLAAKFKFPNYVFLMMLVLFVTIFSGNYPLIFTLFVILIGVFVYYAYGRFMDK